MIPKFKAITTDGNWVESEGQTIITFNDRCFFLRWSFGPDVWDLRESDYIEVIPETVCQFTGLHDKNGKEYAFNEIVQFTDGSVGVLVWFDDRLGIGSGEFGNYHAIDEVSKEELSQCEITGNIHNHLLVQETETCECCGKKFPVSEMRMDEEDANWWCKECLNYMKQ